MRSGCIVWYDLDTLSVIFFAVAFVTWALTQLEMTFPGSLKLHVVLNEADRDSLRWARTGIPDSRARLFSRHHCRRQCVADPDSCRWLIGRRQD